MGEDGERKGRRWKGGYKEGIREMEKKLMKRKEKKKKGW